MSAPVLASSTLAPSFTTAPSGSTADSSSAAQASSCGGPGQRACCVYDKSFPEITPACDSGLVVQLGCSGDCACGTPGGPASGVFFSFETCVAPPPPASSCGGPYERACCALENGIDTQACDAGTVKILGCDGDCACGPTRHGIDAIESCFPKECGGKGQRACTTGERLFQPCDAGLTEIPGCSGDCSSFDKITGNLGSSSMCADMTEYGNIPEPTTNRLQNYANACSLSGYADLHLHLFADTAHGGGVLAGLPYDPNGGGVNVALQQDYGTTKDMVDFNGVNQAPMTDCPYDLATCGTTFFHKDHALDDPVGALGTNDGAGSNLGAPIFNGWPKWTSTTHQQAYYQWVKRAYEGGMRLTTMSAVTNSALCKANKKLRGTNCDDSMAQIDVQIQAAKDFEAWIAAHDGGWFKIAYTPLEARKIIAGGDLAVVLGIEVENLFNCKFPANQVTTVGGFSGIVSSWNFNSDNLTPTCNPAAIETALDHYYDMGVRHVFPVHNFDNAFGAPATWLSGIEFGNRLITKHWWVVEECPASGGGNYGFKSTVGSFGNWASFFSRFIFDFIPGEMIVVDGMRDPLTTTCHKWGLLPLGTALLNGMMDRGMIIDIDHMSRKALDATLAITGARNYPVTASHVLSFDMHQSGARHERMRTAEQLHTITMQGGMIAAMLKDDVQDTNKQRDRVTVPYKPENWPLFMAAPVIDDCQQSSKSFAQAYMYAVDKMLGRPVAFGSDFNGVAAHVGPRFGSDGCGGNELIIAEDRIAQRNAQYSPVGRQRVMNNPLNYPFSLPGFGLFGKQVTGQKTFDFNVDGMAHIGMLPDFVAELQTVGMPQQYVEKIFQSAEEYIRMWERSTAQSLRTDDKTPLLAVQDTCEWIRNSQAPTVVPLVTPPPNAAGWHKTPPQVSFTVTDDKGVTGTTDCHTRIVSTDTSQLVITCTATDADGNVGTGSATVRLDQVAPSVTFGGPSPAANVHGWHRSNVSIAYGAKDDRSGISGAAGGSVSFTVDGSSMTKNVTVTDVAGNSRTATSPAVFIDRVPPGITRARAPLANAAGWNNTPVTVTFACTDALSGVDTCTPPAVVNTEGANQFRSGQVFDRAGNTSSTSLGEISIDLTPPTIAGSRLPLANHHDWNNVPVTVSFSCSDGLSGIASCPAAQTVSTEGANQSRSGNAVDRAGNVAGRTVGSISLDFTPPTITGSRLPLANVHGWNNVNVTASFVCNDALSGVATCPGDSVMSAEAAGQFRNGVVEDRAGNTATTSVTNVNIDKTPPAVTGARVTPANGFGWNNTTVRSAFSAIDSLSGVLGAATANVDLAAEGANQVASKSFSDLAGNSASASVGNIHIDLTPPTIAGSRAPLANVNGWNNTDVTVMFACNDALSGVDGCTPNQTIASEGVNQSRAGQVSDRAGNTAATSVGGIFIDKTAPLISGAPDRAPNVNNWYNANITINFVCSDALSGVGTCAPTPQLISEEGAGLSRTASAMDLAGNTNAATVGGINLDKTPPVVTCTNNAPTLWPPNHKMVPVQLGVGVDGGISGSAGFTLLSATSNEPDNGLGDGDTANDIQDFSIGTADITGALRAERSGRGTGRVYSMLYRGADLAGNVTPCTTTARVPHDQSDKK